MSKQTSFSKPVKRQTLAEQVADTIRESVLAGEWPAGAALPTEPELAQQFGVSRSVIRDATRMLVAQGLLEAQHGRGVYVTHSQVEPFGDALLLALRRGGATAWDVEQFEQLIFPEVCALAAIQASDEDRLKLQAAADDYLALYAQVLTAYWPDDDWPEDEARKTTLAFRYFLQTIFAATHNQLLSLLAQPLHRLRTMRSWQPSDEDTDAPTLTLDQLIQSERRYLQALLDAIASRDAEQARHAITQLMQLPPEAVAAMRQTPIGEVPVIPTRFDVTLTGDFAPRAPGKEASS